MKISFTNLEIDSKELIEHGLRIRHHAWPTSWTRIQHEIRYSWNFEEQLIDWVEKNLEHGNWGYYLSHRSGGSKVVLAFEDQDDAILFNLLGGIDAAMGKDNQ